MSRKNKYNCPNWPAVSYRTSNNLAALQRLTATISTNSSHSITQALYDI